MHPGGQSILVPRQKTRPRLRLRAVILTHTKKETDTKVLWLCKTYSECSRFIGRRGVGGRELIKMPAATTCMLLTP